uniref:Uncharacterized protein n=1 Tax=Oryzias latipes TaxID=8090 RepID=A0A286P9T2_ORYLA|nr:hypothetical protein [Oryzias latipes]
MSTQTGGSRPADIPELFFVASAVKACYGSLPDWEGEGEPNDEPPVPKRIREEDDDRGESPIDVEYRRLYGELRAKALSDIKDMVREHVERQSTASTSYQFMNMYGLCSFEEPRDPRDRHHGREETPRCKFTNLACPVARERTANSEMLVSVCGALSPLVSARVQPGELQLTRCGELDYSRAEESLRRLEARRKTRPVGTTQEGRLGNTIGSMESRFAFCVRRDLHALGCAYRQLMLTVELLHLNILHFLHS